MSYFLIICVFITHAVTSGGKNGCSFDVSYLWAHDPIKFCLEFLMLFVSNGQKLYIYFKHSQIESFLHALWRPLKLPNVGSFGGEMALIWSVIKSPK